MKCQPIVEALLEKKDEGCDRHWSIFIEEIDVDVSFARLDLHAGHLNHGIEAGVITPTITCRA